MEEVLAEPVRPGGVRVALTGEVALELVAPYFREAGYVVHGPSDPPLEAFAPDWIYDVTSHDAVLAQEVPGFWDERMRVLAGMPYALAGIRAIVEEFAWERLRSPRKVLAVDADDTLWDGVVGEEGFAGVRPFAAFQQGLRELRDAGVILVLLSKNDPFELGWFTRCRVNWAPKAANLAEVCRELNVSTDAVVFVDNNAAERAAMAAALPEVAVAPFPADMARPQQFLRRLKEYFFAGMGATEEDRLRHASYRARPSGGLAEDYLADLGLYVEPRPAGAGDLDRLAQMAGKTNQFNATTVRRTRAEFAALLADPSRRVWVFRAGDRFGAQGTVCYVVADLASRRLTDFVMSCRAMGRTLEDFVWVWVARELGYVPEMDFVPTARNAPAGAFFARRLGPHVTYYRAQAKI